MRVLVLVEVVVDMKVNLLFKKSFHTCLLWHRTLISLLCIFVTELERCICINIYIMHWRHRYDMQPTD